MPSSSETPAYDPETAAFAELRGLLLAQEQEEIRQLKRSLERARTAEEISNVLPQAIKLAALRNQTLRAAMQPVIEQSIRLSVRRDPGILSDALLPLISDVVKKTVARAIRRLSESLQEAIEQSITARSFLWRVESIRTGKSYGEIVLVHSMLYRVEQVFLIHRETGLLLAKRSVEAVAAPDAALVSAMLVAIQDFVKDSLDGKPGTTLDTVEAGEYVIWIHQGPAAILAGVIRGVPPKALRGVFESVLESICAARAEALAKFSGDVRQFEPCQGDLARCFLGKANKPVKRLPAWPFWTVAALAASLFLAYFIWAAWQGIHWRSFVATLRNEPGIVVLDARQERAGNYSVSGLRDPLARDPQMLSRQAGYPESAVQFHMESYASAQPQFVAAREFADWMRRVESAAVYFRSDSYEIPLEQLGSVEATAGHVKQLLASAQRLKMPIQVEVIGHSDESGAEQLNTTLAEKRCGEVAASLVALGVPQPALVESTSLDRRSLTGGDMERNRAFSRYVSLKVRKRVP
jgi:outer membrane protein OmpA-like peptidoglycan-associated protein